MSRLRKPWAVGRCLAIALALGASEARAADVPSASAAAQARQPAECRDSNPHETRRVPVAPGVELEVLDWGGGGRQRTLVLLTGLGDNAHVYDDFAAQFTEDFHVIGITRRGFLPSSQPRTGYDVGTRARDDIRVLDALRIPRATFVGHSLAGSELSRLGSEYPGRVDKLVYLDAYDLATRFQRPDIPGPAFDAASTRSLLAFQAAQARLTAVRRSDPSACFGLVFDRSGAIVDSTTPDAIPAALLAGVKAPANGLVDWRNIDAPRLGIFALYSETERLPHYWYLGRADQARFDKNFPGIVDWQRATIARFRQPGSAGPKPVVLELPGFTSHYVYINREDFVVRAMREFLSR